MAQWRGLLVRRKKRGHGRKGEGIEDEEIGWRDVEVTKAEGDRGSDIVGLS